MRIQHATFDDFMSDFESDAIAGSIHNNEIRLRIDEQPDQKEEITFTVILWATYIRCKGDKDFPMVVELGIITGENIAHSNDSGTEAAKDRKAALSSKASELGIEPRAGKVEVA